MDPALVMRRVPLDAIVTVVGVAIVMLPSPRVVTSLFKFTSPLLVIARVPDCVTMWPVIVSAPLLVLMVVSLAEVMALE